MDKQYIERNAVLEIVKRTNGDSYAAFEEIRALPTAAEQEVMACAEGHTMNDNDIVNALWCCNNGLCEICPYLEEEEFSADCRERNGNDALDLINRLSTENERKDRILESYALQYGTVTDKEVFLRKARAEAIKEFAERLKAEATLQHGGVTVVYGSCIDNLVKEMKERNHET